MATGGLGYGRSPTARSARHSPLAISQWRSRPVASSCIARASPSIAYARVPAASLRLHVVDDIAPDRQVGRVEAHVGHTQVGRRGGRARWRYSLSLLMRSLGALTGTTASERSPDPAGTANLHGRTSTSAEPNAARMSISPIAPGVRDRPSSVDVTHAPGARRVERLILGLGRIGTGRDAPDVDERARAERPAVLAQELAREGIARRRDRADVPIRRGIDSGHADTRAGHARDVVDDDPHGSQVDDLDIGPSLGEELGHEPAMAMLGSASLQSSAVRRAKVEGESASWMQRLSISARNSRSYASQSPLRFLYASRMLLGGREQRLVLVDGSHKLARESREDPAPWRSRRAAKCCSAARRAGARHARPLAG